MNYDIELKRVYEPPPETDGVRVLVDRLWPRGKRRDELVFDDWYKDASPTAALRRDWHNKKIDDHTFAQEYRRELEGQPESLLPLMRHARQGRLVLLTAARDPLHSHLPILRDTLLDALHKEDADADGREPSSPVCYNDL